MVSLFSDPRRFARSFYSQAAVAGRVVIESRAALLSLALHATAIGALTVGAVLFQSPPPPEPDQHAEVEVVVGTNATHSGNPPPPPIAPTPPPPPAPSVPVPPAQAAAPDASAASVPQPEQARAPAPAKAVPPPPPPQQQAAQAPRETPQTEQAPPAPPDINLGDGVAATAAEIASAGTIRRAQADSGNVAPRYPPEAARRGEQGTVLLRIYIAPDGTVDHVEIARSSGSAILDRAAQDRIATWHFHPAIREGKPVADVEEQGVRFVRN